MFFILPFSFCVLSFCVFHFVFYILWSPDWGQHVDMPHPMDVDGGAKVEVGLNGGRNLGEERHPVFLVPANNQLQSALSLHNLSCEERNVQMKNSFGSHITIWSAPSQNLPPGKQPNVRNGI